MVASLNVHDKIVSCILYKDAKVNPYHNSINILFSIEQVQYKLMRYFHKKYIPLVCVYNGMHHQL